MRAPFKGVPLYTPCQGDSFMGSLLLLLGLVEGFYGALGFRA